MSPQYFKSDVVQDVDSSDYKKLCLSLDPQGKWMTYLLYLSAWKVESEEYVFNVYFAARFILSSNSNNCCLLYFNTNIMASNSFCPAPSNPVRSTPLQMVKLRWMRLIAGHVLRQRANTAMNWLLEDGKIPRGRLYTEDLACNICRRSQDMDVTWRGAKRVANDHQRWRNLVTRLSHWPTIGLSRGLYECGDNYCADCAVRYCEISIHCS